MHKDQPLKGTDTIDRFDGSLDRVLYFDFEDHQPRFALVSLWLVDAAGSASETGFVLLFEVVDGHPVVTQQFEYDRQAPGIGVVFDKRTRVLTIKARADDGSAHCCPEHLETDEFKWSGQQFKLVRREITDLRKSDGQ